MHCMLPALLLPMLDDLLGRVDDTKHAGSALRAYLWWGLMVRSVLLAALLTLLVVRGNVLAEWVLALNLPFVPQTDVEELTAISYGVLVGLLALGGIARWRLLHRLDGTGAAPDPPPREPGGGAS